MRVLIVEDETAATINLTSILSKVYPECSVVGALETVEDTVRWFAENQQPDLIFMDIHLGDGDAFRIFDSAKIDCPVIFTTAYDRYALEAFRVNSIDYLLKPIKAADLKRAIDKMLTLKIPDKELLSGFFHHPEGSRIRNAVLIGEGDRIIPIPLDDIAYFYTFEEKVVICTKNSRLHPFERSLDSIMAELPLKLFFRANRQFIISRSAITTISNLLGSKLQIELVVVPPEKIVVSKAKSAEFKKWMTDI